MFEKCAKKYIQELTGGMWDKCQFTFLVNRSRETAVPKVTENIQQPIDDGKVVAAVLVDLSKAFDLLDHCTFTKFMHHQFKIGGNVLSRTASYLTGRKQGSMEFMPVNSSGNQV